MPVSEQFLKCHLMSYAYVWAVAWFVYHPCGIYTFPPLTALYQVISLESIEETVLHLYILNPHDRNEMYYVISCSYIKTSNLAKSLRRIAYGSAKGQNYWITNVCCFAINFRLTSKLLLTCHCPRSSD